MGVQKSRFIKRREFLTGVASVPLLGARGVLSEKGSSQMQKQGAARIPPIRLGVIGYGKRAEELIRAMEPGDLNIEFRAVCDVFDLRLKRGLQAVGSGARGYKNYLDMMNIEDLDAVIIATPDHWHAPMAIEAAGRGLHIYLETVMARTLEESKALRDAVRKSGVVFQLGHQGRQRDLNVKARELIHKDTLGKISLVETTTNLNSPLEEWNISEGEPASAGSVDWDLFQGPATDKQAFSIHRYYGWRNYWAYGNGMSGELLTNEYDAVNSIMDLGIPESAIASGGLYYHRNGREVPDVFQASFEFPGRALSLLYSGTLSSGIPRGTLFMGRDASLELGRILSVWADKRSVKYKSRIEAGIIDPAAPFVNYMSAEQNVDAVSSATSKYYADRGLVSTYREGKQVNTTRLHLAEWLKGIRDGGATSCNIDRGFEAAVTARMATRSFLEGRKVRWDAETETIV
ncbi:MAG: Gfo/Idh/MocA family oxidoreductase [Bacteroidales bacterium]|nr:Gfo/Idh/MocA family oxidoreductase [Bacteroidales bacterium]